MSDFIKVTFVLTKYWLAQDQFEVNGAATKPLTTFGAILLFLYLMSLTLENFVNLYIFYFIVRDKYELKDSGVNKVLNEEDLEIVKNNKSFKSNASDFID